jgi:selenocysteine lyase/cysteine desulfurase
MESELRITEFPLDDDLVHLNHAGLAPWPRRTAEAVTRFATENMHRGSRRYAQWLKVEESLREQLQWLINAPSKYDIALLKNTSEGLSTVAFGLDWKKQDNVVTNLQEFPSNRIVWQALEQRFGIEVRLANLDSEPVPEDALLNLIDQRTRLLAVSSVQYAKGLRMDLQRLGAHCRDQDVLFCVDAIQSLGAVPFDVQNMGADFVIADGHKWMLGPEGVALYYCARRNIEQLIINQFGWHMLEDRNDFERLNWTPARDARRFECGSPNSMGVHALHASLSLFQECGMDDIWKNIRANVTYLGEGIDALGLECLTPRADDRRAGIITFRHPTKDNREIYRTLQEYGVICAFRAGGIRFSPHFYTPRRAIDLALDILGKAIT